MNHRMHALCAVVVCLAVIGACSTPTPPRKCTSYYNDVRELGFCDMGPNQAKVLFDKGVW